MHMLYLVCAELGLHFTNLSNLCEITHSMGIRAETYGKLGGGVSICLRSLVQFGWGERSTFETAVAQLLWGRAWTDLMSGEPWPDLEAKIKSGECQGQWPESRDRWGSWKQNLDCALVVSVPHSRFNKQRLAPGNPDYYVLPEHVCEKGAALRPDDPHHYYSNINVLAALLLAPIAVDDVPDGAHMAIELSNSIAIADASVSVMADSARVADVFVRSAVKRKDSLHRSQGDYRQHASGRIARTSAVRAKVPSPDFVLQQLKQREQQLRRRAGRTIILASLFKRQLQHQQSQTPEAME